MVVIDTSALYTCLKQDLADDIRRDPPTVFAKAALQTSLLKKFSGKTSKDADARALDKFQSANFRCKEFGSHVKQPGLFDPLLLGYFRKEIHEFFEDSRHGPIAPSFESVFTASRVGPGKTIGTMHTDLYHKLYASNLTATSERLLRYYRAYVEYSPLLLDAETRRLEMGYGYRVVPGSRLKFVPKNDDISRVICIEPSLNLFFQLGLGELITRRLRKMYRIDTSTQPDVNRELARIGSLDDSLVTLDLESASDSISWKMIVSYFPRSFWTWLWDFRSPFVTLPTGDVVRAYMVSSMGNGFTFPLQTAIFACVIRAAYAFAGMHRPHAGEAWSVFGDDMICEREIAPIVTHLLDLLGFTVNAHKSFFEGPFRESCGEDYYVGTNVRGVYLKHLDTPQDLSIAINALNHWSARHRVRLPKTVQYLLAHLGCKPLMVPRWENDDAGVKVPLEVVLDKLKVSPRYQSYLYRRYQAKPSKIILTDLEVFKAGKYSGKLNSHGAYLAFLAGVLEGRKSHHHASVIGTISTRHRTVLYRKTTGVAPNWDESGHPFGKDVSSHIWSKYVKANLMG